MRKANVIKADLFIAVNPSQDHDMNITSAILAKKMGAKKVIARINYRKYLMPNNKEIFFKLGIDYMFYHEKIDARSFLVILSRTRSMDYIDFLVSKLLLIVLRLEVRSASIMYRLYMIY